METSSVKGKLNNHPNLLIMADKNADIKRIVSILTNANLLDNYEVISTNLTDLSIIDNYDAIILNYYPLKNLPKSPFKQLPWLLELTNKIPIILITDSLGDEDAINCIKSGISGYLLRQKLALLPNIIEESITSFLQKNQTTKLELFCNLTHELRTPLTGIIGFSKMLHEQIYGTLNPKQIQYTHAIIESGKHLLELINDILDLSKIEADKEELLIEKIAVEDICLASLSVVKQLAQEKKLSLKLEINEKISFCSCDQKRVKQILINLLSNGIKFTETGTITLKVTPEKEYIAFSVIDTGIGIKQEDQSKLFQPFVQLQTYIHRQYKGTGLGLALSRKLAQLHGGDLTLTSELGKGSCFTLYLPNCLK
jgi:signal transduction histidine kinase